MNSNEPGLLYVVSLPIGNTDDLTTRALSTLEKVDYIVAEDTREVIKLARILEVRVAEVKSYRDQTHDRVTPQIIADLRAGKHIALVSDRGTPTISDPGFKLVHDVKEAGITVVSVPGASAVVAALSISGLPTDRFTFLGFLPRKASKQRKLISPFLELDTTVIFYESPFRVKSAVKMLAELENADRLQIALAHDITKLHEEVISGSLAEVQAQLEQSKELKGEWVILCRVI